MLAVSFLFCFYFPFSYLPTHLPFFDYCLLSFQQTHIGHLLRARLWGPRDELDWILVLYRVVV